MSAADRLPAGFEALAPWLEPWVLADSQARSDARQRTPIADIRAFYDAMLPEAPRALEHLAGFSLDELPTPEANLLKLMLALAEVAPAVEWYGQGAVVDGFPADRFPAVHTLSDLGPQ